MDFEKKTENINTSSYRTGKNSKDATLAIYSS